MNDQKKIKVMREESKKFYSLSSEKQFEYLQKIEEELKILVEKNKKKPIFKEIEFLLNKFDIPYDVFVSKLINYTSFHSKAEATNDIYRENLTRIIMYFHDYWEGSYHRIRYGTTKKWVKQIKPNSLIDVGYSAPSDYTLDKSILKRCKITLYDFDRSAHELTKLIYNFRKLDDSNVSYVLGDMNKFEYVGDFDVYIFLDSIEHTIDPDKYLLTQVSNAKKGSYFILSIPIAPIDSMKNAHFKEWKTEDDAENWLRSSGLTILDKNLAVPDISIDKFAILIKGGYYNALYLCKK